MGTYEKKEEKKVTQTEQPIQQTEAKQEAQSKKETAVTTEKKE